MEVCVPVARLLKAEGDIVARELPTGSVASVMLYGEYCEFPLILKGYDAAYDWIKQNGYIPNGSPHEIWHSVPSVEQDRIEVTWPFREQSGRHEPALTD
jgi:effector-binding domain-containing protein